MDEKKWLEFIRNQELLSIKKYFSNSNTKKILEIGGNDGYLARIMSDWGFEVTSIDIIPSSTYFDVKKMDALNLEFEENSFDLVFSSSVITQIYNKNMLFKEINRVLKDDGFIIHIVSSTWWSLITNFWHYLFIPIYLKKSLFKRFHSSNKKNKLQKSKMDLKQNDQSIESKFKQLFFHPLGVEKSFIIEIFKFSKKSWRKIFVSNRYTIYSELNGPLTYSGYSIFKNHGYKIRKYFARIFPTSYIFIMKKQIK